MKPNLENLKPSKKTKHGGVRPNSGRKKKPELQVLNDLKDRIANHGAEMIELQDKSGKILKMTRVEALLNVLFEESIKNHNIPALKEYLDRQLGKSVQPLSGQGENGEFIIKMSTYGSGDYRLTP